MKGLNKILSVIFSIIIAVICILVILYVGDIVSDNDVLKFFDMLVDTKEAKLTTVVLSAIIGFAAILSALSVSSSNSGSGASLTLPLTTGNVSISAQTFEAMVLNVAKKYNSLKNVKTRVDIKEEGLYVELFVYVLEGTALSDIMCKIQQDIKTTILKQTTVEVKMVEVRVKGIYNLEVEKTEN